MANAEAHVEGQQHPIGIYFKVWILLFVLSAFSYAVDYFHLEGDLRWTLILIFMVVKAGLIVAIFMHMTWERLALMWAILIPTTFIMLFIYLMASEADHTLATRLQYFVGGG